MFASRLRPRAALVVAAALLALSARAPAPAAGTEVRLALFLVVDQLPYDLWDRLRPLYRGGLADLARNGFVFENLYHEHACTETAPGHATLATGTHPARSGIVGNDWYDRRAGSMVYSLEDGPLGRSPGRLLTTALPDWVKSRSKRSKAFSVAGKDRAAVLLGGKRPDAAYWYSAQTGRMTTSRYYLREAPAWVRAFHDRQPLDAWFGTAWTALPLDETARLQAGIVPLDTGEIPDRFPHPLGGLSLAPDRDFHRALYETPFLDELTLAFARDLVAAEGLGLDSDPDILAVSLSSLDLVGHRYGPDSEEALDTVLRIDAWLADFLGFLRARVGERHLLVVLTSDHGVQPIPEIRKKTGKPAHRMTAEDIACIQKVAATARAHFGQAPWFREGLTLDRELLLARGVDPADFERLVVRELEACAGVERVWTARELSGPGKAGSPAPSRFRNCWHPERSPDFSIQLEPYHLASSCCRTEHGSGRDYDAHVPWIVLAPGVAPGSTAAQTASVDVAPTTASLLGVPYPGDVDGADRSALLLDRSGP